MNEEEEYEESFYLECPELTFYDELVEEEDINSIVKLKDYISDLVDSGNSESTSHIVADHISGLGSLDLNIKNTGTLIQKPGKGKVTFVFFYYYGSSTHELYLKKNLESICLETKSFKNEAIVTLTEYPDFDLRAEDASDGSDFQLQILCDDGECFEGTVEDQEELIEEFAEYLMEKGVFDKKYLSTPKREELAQESTDAIELEKLAGDVNKDVRWSVAENPSTPASALEQLAGDENEDVRCAAAENPNTPVPLLEKLAGDEDEGMRSSVAYNRSTPVSLLEKLVGDQEKDVRRQVASNPNTPVSLLEKLAGDEGMWVRLGVAGNPSTPMEIRLELLKQLAGSKDVYVRRGVAENPNTPVSLLEKLAGDEEEYVRCAATDNPNYPK